MPSTSCSPQSLRPRAPTTAGSRRRPPTIADRLGTAAHLRRRSDRRHARLPRRRREWTVSLAVVEAGRPVAAVLLRPGARLDSFAPPPAAAPTLDGRRLAFQPDRASPAPASPARGAMPASSPRRRACPQPMCASCPRSPIAWRWSPAARSTSPSPRPNAHDWDLAAADLLVHEAGGVLTDFSPAANRAITAPTCAIPRSSRRTRPSPGLWRRSSPKPERAGQGSGRFASMEATMKKRNPASSFSTSSSAASWPILAASNLPIFPSSISSASTPTTARPTTPGRAAPRARSTMRACAISSSTCTASSIPRQPRPRRGRRQVTAGPRRAKKEPW